MCRSIDEITKNDVIVQQLDEKIKDSGGLIYKVLRKNYISHEQNNDNTAEIMGYIKEQEKSPSLTWLLKNKFLATSAVLFSLATAFYIIFHLIEYSIGFQKMVEGLFP